jgi:hypothetical protein
MIDLTGRHIGENARVVRIVRTAKPVTWLLRLDCGCEVEKSSGYLCTAIKRNVAWVRCIVHGGNV